MVIVILDGVEVRNKTLILERNTLSNLSAAQADLADKGTYIDVLYQTVQ